MPTPQPPVLAIADAAAVLRQGGVIAYPTEAVWGLGCDPFDEAATRRLLAIFWTLYHAYHPRDFTVHMFRHVRP